MLKLQLRSPATKEYYGDKFVDVEKLDYKENIVVFETCNNKVYSLRYAQLGFSDTEFRLIDTDIIKFQ